MVSSCLRNPREEPGSEEKMGRERTSGGFGSSELILLLYAEEMLRDLAQFFNSTAISSNGVSLGFSGACSVLSMYITSPGLPRISSTRPSEKVWRL
jgi:hypothetical protein